MNTALSEQPASLAIESAARALYLPTLRQQANSTDQTALRNRLSHVAFLGSAPTAPSETT